MFPLITAFLFTPEKGLMNLGNLGAWQTLPLSYFGYGARAINDAGQVTGSTVAAYSLIVAATSQGRSFEVRQRVQRKE